MNVFARGPKENVLWSPNGLLNAPKSSSKGVHKTPVENP